MERSSCKKYFQGSLINLTRRYSGNETKEDEDKAWENIVKNLVSADDDSMTAGAWLIVCAEGGDA